MCSIPEHVEVMSLMYTLVTNNNNNNKKKKTFHLSIIIITN